MGYRYIRTPTGIIRYDNNFTDEQRARLDTMEVGAQVNAIIGVKGSAETKYRIGLVSISKANVGLGRADNTPDTEKDVATARTLKTGRDIAIGNKTINFDGSSDISYGLLEIGALPLIGGNMIGAINFDLSQISDDKVLVLNNIPVDKFGTYMSNILGTGIYASVNDNGDAIKIRTQGNSDGIDIAVNSNTSTGINITNNNTDAYSIYSRGKNYLDVLILSTMTINEDAEIGGTLTVTGKTTLNDDLDVTKNVDIAGNANIDGTLDVAKKTKLADELEVTKATVLKSTLSITGNTTVGGTLAVTGATTLNDTLGVSGNTTVGGTLGVTGATTLSNALSVTGATTLNSTLGVSGNTTVGGTLGVTGNVTVGSSSTHSSITSNGNLYIKNGNTNKFTVAYDTGNTTVGGTLSVTDATTLSNTLSVTGNTTVGGTLGVTGATTLSSTLDVSGNVTVGDSITHSSITSNGSLYIKNGNNTKFSVAYDTGNTNIDGALNINNTLSVTGATTLSSTLGVSGNTTVGGTLGVTGNTTLSTLGVTGNTTVGGTLGVTGDTTLSTLGVTGNTTVGGTLNVTGATTISDTLTVSKATTLNSTLGVTGNTTVGGTLGITGATTLNNTLSVSGNTTVGGTLGVTGDTTLSGLLTVKANINTDSYSGAINMKNSDIYGLNSIYTGDVADAASEGIHFYRDTTHVDTLWINGGDLLFVPNRELGVSTTKENSQKVARFTANPTTSRIVVTDGTTGGIKSSYALDTAKTANTVVLRDSDGYIRAEYYNQASNAETPDTSSYIIYANSDGWFRKSSLDDIKVILGLGTHAYDSTNYLALSGGTMSGTINSSVTTSTHINGAKGVNVIINSTAAANGYNMLVKMNSTNGIFNLGYYTGKMHMYYISNTKINNNTNSIDKDTILMDESGNFSSAGSVTAATSITAGTSITANAGNVTATGGYLKSTLNNNTITIGSQNASFTHIYNSANIPFIFNNSIMSTDGTLGNSDYPFKGLYLSGSILYKGTKATTAMIKFKDNTADANGNGIIIGGGGLTIIGSGESANTVASQYSTGGTEEMVVSSDASILLHTNVDGGYNNRKTFTFSAAGDFTSPRYVYSTYLNSSASAETPDANSYIMYANSDGWLRKSSLANVKSILGLGSAAYTDSTSYAPSSGSNNYVRVYNSSNVGSSSSVTMNDLAKQHFAMAMIYPKANNPTGADKWVHVINMSWNNTVNTSWVSQIALGVNDGTGMWYRTTSGTIIDRAWTRVLDSSNYSSYALPLTGGTLTGSLTIKKTTAATNTYADANPKLIFNNADASQNLSLTFTDYDSVQSPASLTLNGNQGGEYFIAPNIKATSNIYVGTTAVSLSGHTHNYAGSSSAGGAATIANKVYGAYTGSGGQQGPSYYGKNAAGFLMSNATVNSNTQYKNWLYMDNYSGADVGGATALGLNRMEPRAYIMQSDHNRTSWNNSTEIVTYYNMANAISTALTKAMVTTALGYTPPTTNSTYNFSGTTFYSGKSDTAEHDANNALKNGHYYYTSNGPATSIGASTADGALYVQSYSDTWVGQIAQDYRNGRLFVRGKNNGTWKSWLTVADSGNTVNKGATLAWSTTSTIATVAGVDIKVTMPANPNTNTDTLVTQTETENNNYYPLIFTNTANKTSTSTDTARFNQYIQVYNNHGIRTRNVSGFTDIQLYMDDGFTSTGSSHYAILALGNSQKAVAGATRGYVDLYGANSGKVRLGYTSTTSDTEQTFSDTNGTIWNSGNLKVNGATSYAATTIYAPTSAGNTGQYLRSSGGSGGPSWVTTLSITNTTASNAITITNNGTANGISITNNATGYPALYITENVSNAINIASKASLPALYIGKTVSGSGLSINNTGTGNPIYISNSGTGSGIHVVNSGTNTNGININHSSAYPALYVSSSSGTGISVDTGSSGAIPHWIVGQANIAVFGAREGARSLIFRCDANNYYILMGNSYSTSTWAAPHPFYINNSSHAVTINTASDKRLKNHITYDIDDESIGLLRTIKPVQFTYKTESNVVRNGIYAQDVVKYLKDNNLGYRPYLQIQYKDSDKTGNMNTYNIDEDEEKVIYGIDYSRFVPDLWCGWRHHDKIIEQLQNRIAELEAKVAALGG